VSGGATLGFYLGAGIVFGVICMVIAMGKGIEPWIGFLLGFFFSCLGVVAVLVMKGGNATASRIPPPHPGAQWLVDPTGRHEFRLWDGQRWSAHVSDSGRSGHDPLE
jgi:hypothetical protein